MGGGLYRDVGEPGPSVPREDPAEASSPPGESMVAIAQPASDPRGTIGELRPELAARARALCRPPLDPDDLVQDVLERALRGSVGLRDGARLRSWLFTILTNTFIDRLRQLRAQPHPEDVDAAELAADGDTEHDPDWAALTGDHLRDAVARLPDELREVYTLHALEGRDYLAIAAQLGIAKATVGTRLLRARKQLRALLAETTR
jgi:RNA polymerase sigma-70 factor, ECF subfamily